MIRMIVSILLIIGGMMVFINIILPIFFSKLEPWWFFKKEKVTPTDSVKNMAEEIKTVLNNVAEQAKQDLKDAETSLKNSEELKSDILKTFKEEETNE